MTTVPPLEAERLTVRRAGRAVLDIDRQRHWPVKSASGQQPFGTTTRLVEAG
jgi:hypothetical protein